MLPAGSSVALRFLGLEAEKYSMVVSGGCERTPNDRDGKNEGNMDRGKMDRILLLSKRTRSISWSEVLPNLDKN